jgi:hypothetical protein
MREPIILIRITKDDMRMFLTKHPHNSFIDVDFQGVTVIDLNIEVLNGDLLLENERNLKNSKNFINPVSDLDIAAKLKGTPYKSNGQLTVALAKKILYEYYSSSGNNTSFSIAQTEMLVSVVFELGIRQEIIDSVTTEFNNESFLATYSSTSKNIYFEALPPVNKPRVLLKAVGEDIYCFYESGNILKQTSLAGLANDPLEDAVMHEIFDWVQRSNGHLHLNFDSEKSILRECARSFLKRKIDFDLNELILSNGQKVEYQLILATAKNQANSAKSSGLLMKQLVLIASELNVAPNDLKLFYSGENLYTDYFESLFREKISDVEYIGDDYLIKQYQKKALELISDSDGNRMKTPSGPQELESTTRVSGSHGASVLPPPPSPSAPRAKTPALPTPPSARRSMAPPPPSPSLSRSLSPSSATISPPVGRPKGPPPPPPPPPPPKAKIPSPPPGSESTMSTPANKMGPISAQPVKSGKLPPPPPPPKAKIPSPPPGSKSTMSTPANKMGPISAQPVKSGKLPPPPPPKRK